MAIDKELLDQLLAGRDPQDLFAKDGLIAELKKALSERMLAAELDDHLESEAEAGIGNRPNNSPPSFGRLNCTKQPAAKVARSDAGGAAKC